MARIAKMRDAMKRVKNLGKLSVFKIVGSCVWNKLTEQNLVIEKAGLLGSCEDYLALSTRGFVYIILF